jgi:hypothetical protein
MNTEIHLDYIRFRYKNLSDSDFSDLLAFLSTLGAGHFSFGRFQIARGTPAYDTKYSALGITFIYTRLDEKTGEVVNSGFLDLSGKFFEKFKNPQQYQILRKLYDLASQITRIDCALDIYEYPENLFDCIWSDCQAHKYRGVRTFTPHDSHYVEKGEWKRNRSVYLGSRESPRFLRIYPTLNTHDYDAVRFECELKGFVCHEFVSQFFEKEIYQQYHNDLIVAQCLKTVTFCERVEKYECNGAIKKVSFCEWYQYLLDNIRCGFDRIKVDYPKSTLAKTENWLYRSVSKSLAIFYRMLKGDFHNFIMTLVRMGKERIDNYDDYRMREYRELRELEALKEKTRQPSHDKKETRYQELIPYSQKYIQFVLFQEMMGITEDVIDYW